MRYKSGFLCLRPCPVLAVNLLLLTALFLAGCGDNLEQEKKAAHDAGYQRGYEQGFSKGKLEGLKGIGLNKAKDIAYRMGKLAGEKTGYDRGFDDGLKRIKSGFNEAFDTPIASLKVFGVWLSLLKVLGLFGYVIWFFIHDAKSDELIAKFIAITLGPVFMIFLIQSSNSYTDIMKFLLEPGTQPEAFSSLFLMIIAVSTGVSMYSFYKHFILIRHDIWTETFCVLIASAMLSLLLGFLGTLLEITHDLSDFMATNIFLAVLTGTLFALLVIFIQRAEQQKREEEAYEWQ